MFTSFDDAKCETNAQDPAEDTDGDAIVTAWPAPDPDNDEDVESHRSCLPNLPWAVVFPFHPWWGMDCEFLRVAVDENERLRTHLTTATLLLEELAELVATRGGDLGRAEALLEAWTHDVAPTWRDPAVPLCSPLPPPSPPSSPLPRSSPASGGALLGEREARTGLPSPASAEQRDRETVTKGVLERGGRTTSPSGAAAETGGTGGCRPPEQGVGPLGLVGGERASFPGSGATAERQPSALEADVARMALAEVRDLLGQIEAAFGQSGGAR